MRYPKQPSDPGARAREDRLVFGGFLRGDAGLLLLLLPLEFFGDGNDEP